MTVNLAMTLVKKVIKMIWKRINRNKILIKMRLIKFKIQKAQINKKQNKLNRNKKNKKKKKNLLLTY